MSVRGVTLTAIVGQTKVKDYWPGKAPEWVKHVGEEANFRMAALEKAFPNQPDSDIVVKDDPRLRRLAETRMDNLEEVRADHRRIRRAELEDARRQEELEEEDEDAMEAVRRRIKERRLQREQALLPEEEEEEESEYETDSVEEKKGIAMVKPVLVPKSKIYTIAERKRREAEEVAIDELEKKKLEERKSKMKKILVELILNKLANKNLGMEAEVDDVDTDAEDDDVDTDAEEYEA